MSFVCRNIKIFLCVHFSFACSSHKHDHDQSSPASGSVVGRRWEDLPFQPPVMTEKTQCFLGEASLGHVPKSDLGIYPKGGAAVATDTRPCAHVGT